MANKMKSVRNKVVGQRNTVITADIIPIDNVGVVCYHCGTKITGKGINKLYNDICPFCHKRLVK